MSAKTLYLVPDTNVFIQCNNLNAVDWGLFSDYGKVVLVVTRPVQLEIDAHKNKGNSRVSRKARDTTAKIRTILESAEGRMILRESGPTVELTLRPDLRPAPALAADLDYSETDNKIVGITQTLKESLPAVDVRLLTHDTGPMTSAKTVGIEYAVVPESWRLSPEPTESDKRIRDLEAQVAKLKQVEPDCKIGFEDKDGVKTERLEAVKFRYKPLPEGKIEECLRRVRQSLAMATDFGSKEPETRREKFGFGLEEFTPATEKEIAKYKADYAEWLADIEKSLKGMHETLNWRQRSSLVFCTAINEGARPAKDALVTIRAQGAIEIMPRSPSTANDDADGEEIETKDIDVFKLTPPPKAPAGNWKSRPLYGLDQTTLNIVRGFAEMNLGPRIERDILLGPRAHVRDPNAFYYKDGRPHEPRPRYSLQCEQWRHGTEPEYFEVQIHHDLDCDEVAGALEMRIEAENLSEPASLTLPIRIRIEGVSAEEIADDAVERLTDPVYGLGFKNRHDSRP